MAFDLYEALDRVAELDAVLDSCDNGEGMECASLEAKLSFYAIQCCAHCETIRQWGRAVFSGSLPYEPHDETVLRGAAEHLRTRAAQLMADGREFVGPCFELPGLKSLGEALTDLNRLLDGWVTPKRSVGPLARQGIPLSADAADEFERRIAALPPLPADWQPDDPRQRQLYRGLRSSS